MDLDHSGVDTGGGSWGYIPLWNLYSQKKNMEKLFIPPICLNSKWISPLCPNVRDLFLVITISKLKTRSRYPSI